MRSQPDPHPSRQHVRRVVLPSGKTIEVVYFEEHPDVAAAAPAAPPADLHVCGRCASHLVYPLDWEEAGPRHWEVTLRCPECHDVATGVYDQATVDRFDAILDEGTDVVVRDLKRLMRANMEDEVERFVAALRANAVLPEDF
ncbi:MAG TPA: hypothetical protein VLB47_13350 [Solirubrobacteraceae bacterium]|nr:hypothetical protein [Solirubrobacteraceae bacterium]